MSAFRRMNRILILVGMGLFLSWGGKIRGSFLEEGGLLWTVVAHKGFWTEVRLGGSVQVAAPKLFMSLCVVRSGSR